MCPWNVRFARELPEGSPLKAREFLAGTDARTLARDLLAMTQEEFSAAFSKSPMKRAKLRGLKRNAAVVLGDVGTSEDVELLAQVVNHEPDDTVRSHAQWALVRLRQRDALVAALEDPEPLVRGNVAWALGNIGSPEALDALRARSSMESDPSVAKEIRSVASALRG